MLVTWVMSTMAMLSFMGNSETFPNLYSHDIDICNETSSELSLIPSERGRISSAITNLTLNRRECHVSLRSCSKCRLNLTILNLKLANQCSAEETTYRGTHCPHDCDVLVLYEPSYSDVTVRHVTDVNSMTISYLSLSSEAIIKMCLASNSSYFELGVSYFVSDKQINIYGESSGNSTEGHFASPNFPLGYALSGEIYTVTIESSRPDDRIYITFDDYDIDRSSTLVIYDAINSSYSTNQNSANQRPAFVSTTNILKLEFHTGHGEALRSRNQGYMARYSFINDTSGIVTPHSDCDDNFRLVTGANVIISNNNLTAWTSVDCIWAYFRHDDYRWTSLFVRSQQSGLYNFSADADYFKLEIRNDSSALGALTWETANTNFSAFELVTEHSLYVRLRSRGFLRHHIIITFTSFNRARRGRCWHSGEFVCDQIKCIDYNLACDGIKHCRDGSDEEFCTEITERDPSSINLCRPHEFSCHNGRNCVPLMAVCDRWLDCTDGSDEYHCKKGKTERINSNATCHAGYMPCRDDVSECVDKRRICDGIVHCLYQSESTDCRGAVLSEQDLAAGDVSWSVILSMSVSCVLMLTVCALLVCSRIKRKSLRLLGRSSVRYLPTISGRTAEGMYNTTSSRSPMVNPDSPPSYEQAVSNLPTPDLGISMFEYNSAFPDDVILSVNRANQHEAAGGGRILPQNYPSNVMSTVPYFTGYNINDISELQAIQPLPNCSTSNPPITNQNIQIRSKRPCYLNDLQNSTCGGMYSSLPDLRSEKLFGAFNETTRQISNIDDQNTNNNNYTNTDTDIEQDCRHKRVYGQLDRKLNKNYSNLAQLDKKYKQQYQPLIPKHRIMQSSPTNRL